MVLGKAMCVSVNGIIRLIESVGLGPKVIPLSGAHCITFDQVETDLQANIKND